MPRPASHGLALAAARAALAVAGHALLEEEAHTIVGHDTLRCCTVIFTSGTTQKTEALSGNRPVSWGNLACHSRHRYERRSLRHNFKLKPAKHHEAASAKRLDQEPLNSSPSESPETSLAIRLSKSGYLEAARYTDLQNSICATWIYLLFKQDTASCRHLSPPASACPSLGSKC